MKNLFLITLLTLTLTACGGEKATPESTAGDRTAAAPQLIALSEPSKIPEPANTTEVKQSYRIVVNDCDTGRHDFVTRSFEETQKQLCEALQDDLLNHSCAEQARHEVFEVKCEGFSWNPKRQTS